MRILVREGERVKALTKEQFDAVHDTLVERMNSGKPLKDAEVIDLCSKAKVPVDFKATPDVVALSAKWAATHREEPDRFPDLSMYLGDTDLYIGVREYLSDEEMHDFIHVSEEQRRMFLLSVAAEILSEEQ